MLAIMASMSAYADRYYRVNIIPVEENGAEGNVFAFPYQTNTLSKYQDPPSVTKAGLWSDNFSGMIHQENNNTPQFYLIAQGADIYSVFMGWYWDENCTQPLFSTPYWERQSISKDKNNQTFAFSTTDSNVPTVATIYAKFTKFPAPAFDWSPYATTTFVEGKKYYIYNPVIHMFLKATSTTAATIGEATIFTYSLHTTGTDTKAVDYTTGNTVSMPYTECLLSYEEDGISKYMSAEGKSYWGRTSSNFSALCYVRLWEGEDNTFVMTRNDTHSTSRTLIQIQRDGNIEYKSIGSISYSPAFYWMFIPEDVVIAQAQVNSVNENGAVTITDSPTASGTAYVKFNVSAGSIPAGFNYELTGGDGHFDIVEESVTCSGGVLTVPVTYTAQNVHAVSSPASTATVTVTSVNGGDPVEGTVTAYVDLQPKFALMVDELDWNAEGETIYKGMEIAASQRTYLANKLIYNPAQTTGVAANNATWTATIEGTNADQFKFANGTREVSGAYSASLLDVIYAPTTTGEHTATLHIVTSYTASNGEQTYQKNITLQGTGSAASRITFAANGSETPLTAEIYNYGDIIGTNHKDVTAELFISQITSPSYVWNDPAEVFELDESTIDLTKKNQTLSFRAHPDNPVATNTDYTATLTVSGKGTANEDVSATLTLTYRALPLTQTTVEWHWGTMKENRTVTNPISTNSDGVWVLTKTAGDAVTYNDASKSATAAYLHHEPGKTAAYILSIPQTDTYTAFEQEYETEIIPLPKHVVIDSQSKLTEYAQVTRWEKWYEATKILYVDNDNIYFSFEGQTVLEFDFAITSGNSWTLKEYNSSGSVIRTIQSSKPLTVGHNVFTISPQTTRLNMYGKGNLSNIQYYEVDTISADYPQAALIRDGNNVSSLDVTTTFSNKRVVTASLNATAAQYFEISCAGKSTGSSFVFNGDDGLGLGLTQNKVITVALKDGVNVNEAQQASMGNTCVLTLSDDYTYNHEELSLPIVIVSPSEITYKHSDYGTYVVTYSDNVPHTVSSADYVKTITDTDPALYVVTLSAPTPTASGYVFQGWKIGEEIVSCAASFTTSIGRDCEVIALFDQIKGEYFKVGNVYYDDLTRALSVAGNSAVDKVVTVTKDTILGDGHTPITYTIPAGVTLLVPYKDNFYTLQETPEVVRMANKEVLSAYRTLTLTEGVNIICNGNICVSAKLLSSNGGNKSAYPTDECGVINMANGGHIELNSGANLYCWGYIKGQDMDQGNNTQGTGTVTANAGSVVWENFELGDWRGGTASLDIYNNNVIDHRKLFPFQSYAIQNVEVPTSFKYGAVLRNFTSITTGMGDHGAVFSMIGPSETMFLLTDEQSMVRTWYDPTTDLTCYELSGTAQLDALHITVYVSMSSEDFILPICNSMHIILKDCNMTLSNPLMMQAGSIIEIKSTATINLENELYLYDKDQWGKYTYDCYFRSFNNLTSHKDRGDERSKDGLDDAKLIVDGVLNVQTNSLDNTKVGRIYATAGGANVMGNGGGEIHFKQALPSTERLWAVDTIKGEPYIKWVYNPVTAANLCNEDGSYTKSQASTSYYNVHGRWFYESEKDEQSDHTYNFYYLDNGNTGEETWTAAVYSNDKTGLEARMKWFNVSQDEEAEDYCPDWWKGATPTAFYNYSMLGEWHQFIETETAELYSGSDNALYQKEGCTWVENGAVDKNCLYTIDGVKKALVDGEFIPLESNGYDPAYHNGGKYYICFSGCNWHEATPYAGESKAYTINPEAGVTLHYIWFNNDWMNVLRDEPFFYTMDEQTNVKTYYEYLNGEWEIATPYVSVTDVAETRTFYMIKEAFNVASIKKNATITLLRDLPNVSEVLSYSTQNTTCTLDLNGHLLSGNIANLLTVNAQGATFTITDNTTLKLGKISSTQNKAVYVQKGALVVTNGTIETTAATAIEGAASTTITINGGYFAANTKCVQTAGSCSINGGHFTKDANLVAYAAAHKYPFETTDPKYKWEVSDAWTITFKNGETTLQTLRLKPGETPVYTENQPTKDGFKFTGWSPAVVPATADATYTAQFEAASASESRVTLNSNGGNEGLQYVYVSTGSAIGTVPEGTTKEGYTFAGWFTAANGGTQITSSTTVSADVTWYAHYTKASYTLTWDANGGELSGVYTQGEVEYGAAITAPTATMSGHTFLCWNITPATTMPAQNVTYTAQWSIAAKHFLQNIDGSYPATPEATEDISGEAGEYVTPAAKTYDGFITPATQTVRIGETTEVTYNYARRTYTLTLDATSNGGTCATASVEVKHGATPTLPVATKEGYTFQGWFTNPLAGDRITNETTILRNIGTLYAHFIYPDIIVGTSEDASSENKTLTEPEMEVNSLIVEKDGTIRFDAGASLQVENLILEATTTASGQILGLTGSNLKVMNHAYFDLTINAKARTWYAVAVPWNVDAASGIIVNNTPLRLGIDMDVIRYDGAQRAAAGKVKDWIYLEYEGDKTMYPGTLYMIYLANDASVIRFKKKDGPILTTSLNVYAHPSENVMDAGWNGIANPALYHAYINASANTYTKANFAQKYNPANEAYDAIDLTQPENQLIVGAPIFVQVASDKPNVVAYTTWSEAAAHAPRRAPRVDNAYYEVQISAGEAYTDRIYLQTLEDKEDRYVIGLDLAKAGVSNKVAQMWVNRYNAKLCVNTTAPVGKTATYPLGISVPENGTYQISSATEMQANQELYVTRNGNAIWNLAYGPYTVTLDKGTYSEYGIKLIQSNAPAVTTGVDQTTTDKLQIQKVLIDNKVYIVREGALYTITGQKVE